MKPKVTFKWLAALVIIMLLLFMSGCSALTGLATSAVTGAVTKQEPLLGIDTEVVAGDKVQGVELVDGPVVKWDEVDISDNAQLHTTSTGKNTEIDNAQVVNLEEGVPFWQAGVAGVILFLLGIFMPQLTINRKK